MQCGPNGFLLGLSPLHVNEFTFRKKHKDSKVVLFLCLFVFKQLKARVKSTVSTSHSTEKPIMGSWESSHVGKNTTYGSLVHSYIHSAVAPECPLCTKLLPGNEGRVGLHLQLTSPDGLFQEGRQTDTILSSYINRANIWLLKRRKRAILWSRF